MLKLGVELGAVVY